MENAIKVLSTLGTGALLGVFVKSILDRKAKIEERNYAIKRDIYVRVSTAMQEWLGGANEEEIVQRIQIILGEAYVIAPDKVMLGIKKVWEDRDDDDKIKGENIRKLVYALRQDLVPDTKLKNDDHIVVHF